MSASPRRSRLRGFTLLELLVVVSIMTLALLAFATVIGSRSSGPALERTAGVITAMVANVRQNASVRKVHSEIVFDYKNDRVIALARRRLVSFAMEDDVGSGDTVGRRAGGAQFVGSRAATLRDGKCLELPSPSSSFTIQWAPHFDVQGDYEGMALAFDYYPMEGMDQQGLPMPFNGGLVSMGSVFTLSVAAARENSVRLVLASGGVVVQSRPWIACYRWHRIELSVSRYGVSLWIDGRLDEGVLSDGFEVMPAAGQDLRLSGTICRIDNLELFSLVSSQTLQLEGCQFIPEEVDPMKEALGHAEGIYLDRSLPPPTGPVTGPEAPEITGPGTGLPAEPVPAIRHIYFDTAGKLDPARHAGAVEICMVSLSGDDLRRMVLTFHPLGTLTWEYVDRFWWEPEPDPLAGGGG
ncbi:MAG: type II secretion system protein [Planctomycetes bacterium]|jgi:prepilin-type N-terminal cleavage/methylation domain-containing protein|nr:type II secretion system protein [Planctomycetota bacterium]MCL4729181.1 type II secretion system protein [Planctomycetota bacterium]